MGSFNPNAVLTGPGTLYVAPLGTTEPTALTGAWPTGWVELGYTDQGSTFSVQPNVSDVEVEEEYWPVRRVTDKYSGSIAFGLAETTATNLLVALNGGVGSSKVAALTGTGTDGSSWIEPPDIGEEVRVMLGWDSLAKGATTGTGTDGSSWIEPPDIGEEVRVMLGWDSLAKGATTGPNAIERLIIRQALQDGQVQRVARKGNNKQVWACQFGFEKPAGVKPFRIYLAAALAA